MNKMTTLGERAKNIAQVKPKHSFKDLLFPAELQMKIEDILDDFRFREDLQNEGVAPVRKILIHGPSGCGKTSIVHALALAFGAPLYQMALHQVIDSLQGETSKNLASAIEFANANKCIMLLDEFDAIASQRVGAHHGVEVEHNRSVNTLLVQMDSLEPLGMVVACTNFLEIIDQAALRRFDIVLEVGRPPIETLLKIIQTIFNGRYGLTENDLEITDQDTPATVTMRARELLRRKIINKAKLRAAETVDLFTGEITPKTIRKKILTPQEACK